MRALAFMLVALAAACASAPDAGMPRARIAKNIMLTLPTPPGYPQTRTIVQTGWATYGKQQAAFEAVLSLGTERTEIILTMLAGPRLATIIWDADGVREERSIFAPKSVPVENILADIFVSVWPAEEVSAALPEGVSLSFDTRGGRTITHGGEVILSVIPDVADPMRFVVRNQAFGYEVAIVRQGESP